MQTHPEAEKILQFWFSELQPAQWWIKSADLDEEIRHRFLPHWEKASRCETFTWRKTPQGRLAEIIVLDQFSRQIFRGLPQSFSQDPLALALAQEMVARGEHDQLPIEWQSFVYLPYMHSESLLIHKKAIELYSRPGLESNLAFEMKHKTIIEWFGRYPHRNDILGRKSTPKEIEFLKQPGSSF